MTNEQLMAERYGHKPANAARSRRNVIILAAALLGAFLSWAIWANFLVSAAPKPTVIGYEVIDDLHTQIRFTAANATSQDAVCTARVLNKGYGVVGFLEVTVPAGTSAEQVFSVSVNTTELGVTGVADHCRLK